MRKLLLMTVLGASLFVPILATAAAIDGTLGTTSTGYVDISLGIQNKAADEIQITGFTDFDFGSVTEGDSGDITLTDTDICVYSPNGGTYNITIEAESSVDFGAPNLVNAGGTVSLPYSLAYDDPSHSSSSFNLTPSQVLGCTDGITAKLSITITLDPNLTVDSDEFLTDTISVLVSPN